MRPCFKQTHRAVSDNGVVVPGAEGVLTKDCTMLPTGVTVEIMTTKDEEAGPSEDWLKFVRSSRARTKIRQHFAKERVLRRWTVDVRR